MVKSGYGEFNIDPDVIEQCACDLEQQRRDIHKALENTQREMRSVAEAMQSEAGRKLIARFNNLVDEYCNRYVDTMEAHARYLDDIAIRYRESDEYLKGRTEGAFASFEV